MTPADTGSTLPPALASPRLEVSHLNFALALLGAGILHLFLILAVSFEMPEPAPGAASDQGLEILILRDQGIETASPALDAALSQRSRYGESNQGDAAITATVPEETPPEVIPTPFSQPETQPASEAVAAPPESETARPAPPVEQAMTPSAASPAPTESAEHPSAETEVLATARAPLDPLEAPLPPKVDAAQILGSRNQEIARLTESLEARTAAYSKRQRRTSVSASTREFRYASYLGAWARKVERIGNLNYPQAAKDQNLYGSLILHVAVRRDGSVEAVRIVRSSGYDLLDQAAIKIVELAAPYAPFPPDIAAETDVLDIIRTWQFQRGGKLGWER